MRFVTLVLLVFFAAGLAGTRLDAPPEEPLTTARERNIRLVEQAISAQTTALHVYHKMIYTSIGTRREAQIVVWYGHMAEVRAFRLLNDLPDQDALRVQTKSQLLPAFGRFLDEVGSGVRKLSVEEINREYQRISKQVLDSP